MALSPQQMALALEQYHVKKALIDAENKKVADQQQAIKKEVADFWAEKRKPKIVTTRKIHPCGKCHKVIPEKTQAIVKKETVGYGYPEGYHYVSTYFHLECQSNSEEKKTDVENH